MRHNSSPLRTARKRKALTQRALARQVGVTDSAISLFEARKCKPEPAVAIKLANALGLTLDEIYGRKAA